MGTLSEDHRRSRALRSGPTDTESFFKGVPVATPVSTRKHPVVFEFHYNSVRLPSSSCRTRPRHSRVPPEKKRVFGGPRGVHPRSRGLRSDPTVIESVTRRCPSLPRCQSGHHHPSLSPPVTPSVVPLHRSGLVHVPGQSIRRGSGLRGSTLDLVT